MIAKNVLTEQLRIARGLLATGDGREPVVIATYTQADFMKLRPNENYQDYKQQERAFIEALAAEGLIDRIKFENVDAAGYAAYLARNGATDYPGMRAAYAAEKYKSVDR